MSEKYQPFSQRHGYTQPKLPQREEMDDDLRTGLWNAFYESFPPITNRFESSGVSNSIYKKVFIDFLKKHLDEYCDYRIQANDRTIKRIFLFEKWHRIFDLMEYVTQIRYKNATQIRRQRSFINKCNAVLTQENSAYRIVDKFVVEIASEQETTEIQTALQIPFGSAKSHLEKALALFSDRENPDFENSIKESISAVESIAQEVTGKEKSLNALTQTLKLHPKFKTALDELYNWTSKDGIRHAKSGKSTAPDQATARFMLVTCSAFVNYVVARKQPK